MPISRRAPVSVSSLESRLLLSAAPIEAAMPTDGDVAALPTTQSTATFEDAEIGALGQTSQNVATLRRELVILDSRVHDIEQLVSDLTDSGSTQFDVFVLDAEQDGVEQINEILASYQDVDALHLISHGEDGEVRLGNTWLGESNLDAYAGELTQWRDSLSAKADILFYGCDLAGSSSGQTFLEAFATLTDADVAASLDDTGHTSFGANWDLEYTDGFVETDMPFSSALQSNWEAKLATITVDTFDDVVDSGDSLTSLREAIIEANAGGGGDVIDLETIGAGTFRLTLSGTGSAANGDLDITTSSLTIRGIDANSTIINASGLGHRVLHVHSGSTLTAGDLSITGGSAGGGAITNGGGVLNSGTLNLTNAVVSGNTAADDGGGIYSAATSTTTLENVEVSFNDANRGGAIAGEDASVNLTNVTISTNHADAQGGGVFLDAGNATVRNSTLAYNTAGSGARGIHLTGGAGTLTNTIVHNPDGTNLVGSFTDGGTNINSDGSGGLGTNVDPGLDANLRLNTGTTRTHALTSTSAARNAGTDAGAPATDQRGFGRTGAVDIGAYEFSPLLTPTGEQLVNTTTVGEQSTRGNAGQRGSQQAVAVDGLGNSVVVWTDAAADGNGTGVFAQRFDIDGNAVGSEFQVNTDSSGDQYDATVAMDESGRFVIAFTSDNGTSDVYLRRFNADGTAFDANDIRVNHGQVSGDQFHAELAVNASGQIVVAWESDGDGIFARTLEMTTSLTGNNLSTQTLITVDSSGSVDEPSVDINDSGRYVVTWEDGGDLYGRRYDFGNTTALSGRHDLNIAGSGEESVVVAVQSDNDFVIAYRSNVFLFNGIWTRAFNADGSAKAVALEVGTGSDGQSPSIAIDASDNYIVTWQDNDADGVGVFARSYDESRSSTSGITQINVTTASTQQFASVAMVDPQNFIVVWSGNGAITGQTDSLGVFMRRAGTAFLPSDIGPNTFSIDEGTDTSGGTSLGVLTATDADTGETFQWRILPGLDGGSFSIGGSGNDELILDDGVLDAATKASYQVRVEVVDGTDNSYNEVLTVTVNDANSAPTLAAGTLTSINEDDFNSSGDTVSDAFSGQFSDADAGSSFSGIAVIGNSASATTEGVWQYASDGTTWRDIGTVSDAAALTISAGSRIRFVPVADFTGTPTTLNVRGLDNTHTTFSTTPGTESRSTLDTSSPGGTSAISDPATTLSISVINNATPVIAGVSAGQSVDDNATVNPFASVTLTDAEADNVSVIVRLSGGDTNGSFTTGSLGNFTQTAAGEYTLTSRAIAAAQAALRALVFEPSENQVAAGSQVTTTFTIEVSDATDTTSDASTTVSATSINNAPSLASGGLADINEGDTNPAGETVATIFTGDFSDADVGASFSGIAVITNDADAVTQGSWQYSSDGTTWSDIGTVSDTNALTIASGSRLRFVPASGFTGAPNDLEVRGLDETFTGGFSTTPTSENRVTINANSPGGSSPLSDPATTVSINVIINATPTIGGVSTAAVINDNDTTSPFSGVTLADTENDNVSVVIQLSGGDANGSFTAASLGGFAKTGIGEYTLSSTTVTAAQTALRGLVFDPTENQVAVGSQVTTTFTLNVSDATDTLSDANTSVNAVSVNDAPSLNAGALTAIGEGELNSSGDTVSDAFSGQFSDPDVGSSFSGIVVIANNANSSTQGVWQYSSDGTTWRDIGTVTDAGALTISAASRIRFVPVVGFTGSPTALEVRGLDNTHTSFSTTPTSETRQTIDTSSPGGSSAISDPATTLSINVLNNATPVIAGVVGGQAVNDNATLAPFAGVTLTDAENDNVSVVVRLSGGDANGIFATASLGGFTKTGTGEYTLANTSVGAAQTALRGLSFDPTENQVAVGTQVGTTFTIEVSDDTDTASDANTSVSSTSVNDAPTLSAAVLASVGENDFNGPGETVATLFSGQFTDPDIGASLVGIAVVENNANAVTEGVWQYASDGVTWRDIGTVSDANALAISAASRLRFVPVSGFSGSPTALGVRGLDNTHSGFSATPTSESRVTVNASAPGGSTPISDPATTVSTSVTNNANPVIGGAVANQPVNDNATVSPFSGLTITDAENDNVTVVITLSSGDTNGSFTAGSLGAFTKTATGEYTLTSSTPAAAQTAIRGLVFQPTENQIAAGSQVSTTFSVSVSDATGTALNADTSVDATSINNAPTLNAGTLPAIAENDFTSTGSTIATIFAGHFTDVDSAASLSGIAVIGNTANAVTEGEWQYSSDGTTWSEIGTVSDGSALAIAAGSRIRFVPVSGFSGTPAALEVRGLDDTHTGFSTTAGTESRVTIDATTSGGTTPLSDPATTISIDVLDANEAPVNTVPANVNTTEAAVTPVTGISISDADAGTASLRTRLQVTGGVLNVTLSGGTTVVNGTNGSGDFTLEGSIADLNATLTSLTYQGNVGVTGIAADTITITTDDQGNTGSGGAQTDTDTIQVNIAGVNQAPVVTAPATLAAVEDTPVTVTGLSVTDSDAGGSEIRLVLSAQRGRIRVDSAVVGGVTNVSGNSTTRVVLVGTVAEINATLSSGGGVTYLGANNYFGADILEVTANDLGNSGAGGPQTDQQQIAVTVSPENDAPIARNDRYSITGQNGFRATRSVLANDIDVDGPALSANLVSGPSNGSLQFNPDGTFIYLANSDFSGADFFTYVTSDGSLTSNVATVRILVAAPPPTPTLPPTDPVDPPTDTTDTSDSNDSTTPSTDTPPVIAAPPATTPTSSTKVDSSVGDFEFESLEDSNSNVRPAAIEKASGYQFVSIARTESFQAQRDQLRDAEVSSGALSSLAFTSQMGLFWQQLDRMGDQIDSGADAPDVYFTGTAAATSAISVGYVIWLLKGGHLLAGVLAQVPAWRLIDPIPILAHLDEEDDLGEDDSLQDLMDRDEREEGAFGVSPQ